MKPPVSVEFTLVQYSELILEGQLQLFGVGQVMAHCYLDDHFAACSCVSCVPL